jgi:GTP-binding protein Era
LSRATARRSSSAKAATHHAITSGAPRDAEAAEQPVHLFLFVIRKLGDDPERYREMRLDFPKGE